MKWISVEDRLPENSKCVLVMFTHETLMQRAAWFDVACYVAQADRWIGNYLSEAHNARVMFWMPIPPYPEVNP